MSFSPARTDLALKLLKTITVNGKESSIIEEIFDKTSNPIARLVNKNVAE